MKQPAIFLVPMARGDAAKPVASLVAGNAEGCMSHDIPCRTGG